MLENVKLRSLAVLAAFAIVASALVPSPAFANDGDWLWSAPASDYTNRSAFFYAYMVEQGYPINTFNNVAVTSWDSLSFTDQLVLSRCANFSFAVNNFTALWPFTGDYIVVAGATMDFNAIQLELQQAYDKLHESDGPLNGGSLGGGGGGGGIPDEPDEPGTSGGPTVDDNYVVFPVTAWAPNPRVQISAIAVPVSKWNELVSANTYGYSNFYLCFGDFAGQNRGTSLQMGFSASINYYNYSCGLGNTVGTYREVVPDSAWVINDGVLIASDMFQVASSSGGLIGSRPIWYRYEGPSFNPENIPESGTGGGSSGGTVTPVPEPSTIERPESPASPSAPTVVNVDMPELNISTETVVVPPASEAPDLSTIENLLRLILQADNNIITGVNELGSWLYVCWDEFSRFMGEYASNVSYWLSFISGQLNDLWEQGDAAWEWLRAIDMDIQTLQAVCISGFDDVVSWLQAIFERLIASVGGSKPSVVDPQEPETVLDWLKELWGAFWDDLASILPDDLADFVDFLGQLKRYFPFSIPWDIFAILMLLVHEPVTPSVTVPVFWVPNSSDTITIDMAGWEPMAAMIRPMVALWFAYRLALMTASLLEIPDKLRRK